MKNKQRRSKNYFSKPKVSFKDNSLIRNLIKEYNRKVRYYGSKKRLRNIERRAFWNRWERDNIRVVKQDYILTEKQRKYASESFSNPIKIPLIK